jgi:hypothetical protein
VGSGLKRPPNANSEPMTKAPILSRINSLNDPALPDLFSPQHSFRVTVDADLLNQSVPREDVQ